MPRTKRASVGGICYHVLNRGNGCAEVFHKDEDYAAFLARVSDACERLPMRVLGYCLMPNHFHLVLHPHRDADLSRWMQWLMTSHVRAYHRHYSTSGHVWQGRFKAFAIQQDEHLLAVTRYVERNALRAKLVERAEDWEWGSLRERFATTGRKLLSPLPVERPRNWLAFVNQSEGPAELDAVRRSVLRGAPFGEEKWARTTAGKLGVESSLKPRGRPRSAKKQNVPINKGDILVY